jgi:hypothetical protein
LLIPLGTPHALYLFCDPQAAAALQEAKKALVPVKEYIKAGEWDKYGHDITNPHHQMLDLKHIHAIFSPTALEECTHHPPTWYLPPGPGHGSLLHWMPSVMYQ